MWNSALITDNISLNWYWYLLADEEPENRRKILLLEFFVETFWDPSCRGLWIETAGKSGKGCFAGNCVTLTAWCDVFLSLADFKSDLSWTNLKLSSSATWPLLHTTYQTRNVLHCIAHIGGDENVKTLFFFPTKEVIINLIPKFVTSILKSLVITAIWLALNLSDTLYCITSFLGTKWNVSAFWLLLLLQIDQINMATF